MLPSLALLSLLPNHESMYQYPETSLGIKISYFAISVGIFLLRDIRSVEDIQDRKRCWVLHDNVIFSLERKLQ